MGSPLADLSLSNPVIAAPMAASGCWPAECDRRRYSPATLPECAR
jgi:hypothetical protein